MYSVDFLDLPHSKFSSGCPWRSVRRTLLPQPTKRADNRAGGPRKQGAGPIPNITDDMRSGPDQRPRGRFNANRPFRQQPRNPQNNQTFDSNGPNIKIRGSAHQIFERYVALAREATATGDRIAAENFYQHAEHYFRLCQVYVLGTSDGCIVGRDYQGIETSSPARFPPMVV